MSHKSSSCTSLADLATLKTVRNWRVVKGKHSKLIFFASKEYSGIDPPMFLCGVGLLPLECGLSGLLTVIAAMLKLIRPFLEEREMNWNSVHAKKKKLCRLDGWRMWEMVAGWLVGWRRQ